jgi:hypothetical protein
MGARDSCDRSLNRSLNIATVKPRDADADDPIPDPEKSTLVAPPAHEHPAHHPLPGQTPNVPVYSQSQHSAHPASRSMSTRAPAYNSLPSQSFKRSQSYAPQRQAYNSIPPQSTPEPTYDPQSQLPRAPFRSELLSPEFSPLKLSVPEESPELPALTFSPISLDTSKNTTPGTTYHFPSPSEMAPIPVNSSPTDLAPSIAARFPSPSQIGQSIENFRPTPLTATEIAELGISMSPFRPTPLSEASASPPPPTHQSGRTEHPFQSPPRGTSANEPAGFTPFSTPSLNRVARNLTHRLPSIKGKGSQIPPLPAVPNSRESPTPSPLKFKKHSAERPTLPAVKTTYTSPKKPTPAEDLPFNYISLPSPQSPSSPSAIQLPSSRLDAISRTASTYSIPIGLARSHKRQSTANSAKVVAIADKEVRLTHNHSREWSESDREHVMSWATYNGPDSPLMEGDEVFSPMIEQIARAERVERMEKVEAVQVQGGKLLRKSPQNELGSDLDGRELERKSPELKRKSSQQDLREGGKEGRTRPTKLELRRTSRIRSWGKKTSDSIMTSPKKQNKMGSPKSEKVRDSPGREEVSPLFTPIQAGHRFSPLSPKERQWVGQR